MRWIYGVTLVALVACKGGGSGGADGDVAGDDDDDVVHSTLPWSQVTDTQQDCCSTVKVDFQWTESRLETTKAQWAMPPDPIGAVVVFHGSNGSIAAVQQIEWLELYNVLYDRGIGVMLLNSVDRGDGGGKAQWSELPGPDNPDVDEVDILLATVADESDFEFEDPVVTIGYSNGAKFSLLCSGAAYDRGRNIRGAVMHNGGNGFPDHGLPGLWVSAENDSSGGGADNMQSLAERQGNGSLHLAGDEIPLHPARFAKQPQFDEEESIQLFDLLVEDRGWVDAAGNRLIQFEGDPDEFVDDLENQIPVNNKIEAAYQLRVVWALHRMSAQHKLAEAAWIEEQLLR